MLLRAASQLMFLHGVEYRQDTVYDQAIFEAFFARENFSDFLQVRFFWKSITSSLYELLDVVRRLPNEGGEDNSKLPVIHAMH